MGKRNAAARRRARRQRRLNSLSCAPSTKVKVKTKAVSTIIKKLLVHEKLKPSSHLCGIHSLNNALNVRNFITSDLSHSIAKHLGLTHSSLAGDFSVRALNEILQSKGKRLDRLHTCLYDFGTKKKYKTGSYMLLGASIFLLISSRRLFS